MEFTAETLNVSAIGMSATVKGIGNDGESWKDAAEITSCSLTGAGIRVQHECRPGNAISLSLPLPPDLRAYDHDKVNYRVWGIVQQCQPARTNEKEEFYVGLAFIGKNPPPGYQEDPKRQYRICGVNRDGLWKVEGVRGEFKNRREMRYWTPFELYLAQIDPDRKTIYGAKAQTENISRGGAAVISELDVNVGDRVKFISEQFDFSGLAVVCGRQTGEQMRSRLHLRFVDNKFPVERLKTSGIAT